MYVAVDRNCRDRMVFEHGISEQSIHLLTNPVDLQRFARRSSLPPKPARALVFSNNADDTWIRPIRAACQSRGIAREIAGGERPIERPEEVLPQYDLVFAKARCAIEALAAGCGVIVCDAQGLCGLVTTSSLEAMRQLNFGARTLRRAINAANIGEEIDRYDPADSAAVCTRIRQSADSDLLADQFIALYDELCAQPPAEGDELLAVSRSLSRMAAQLYAHTGTGQVASARSGVLTRLVRWFGRLIRA
jgi:hypothetical protein